MAKRQTIFTPDEFADRFDAACLYCVETAIARNWLPAVPLDFRYHCGVFDHRFHLSADWQHKHVPAVTLMPRDTLLSHLQRDSDGFHHSWINLSPMALLGSATVITVSFNRDDWVDFVFADDLAVGEHEPFQIRGPALPPGWSDGDPIPCVQLPLLHPLDQWNFPPPTLDL
jgi:hypothetical protein